MRVQIQRIGPDFKVAMADEYRLGERAVTRAMRSAAANIKARWRADVTGSGLSGRLANTIRSASYPEATDSMNAAAMVWTKAPKIIGAHNAGPLIRAKNSLMLAIPLPAAGRGPGNQKLTPAEWQFKHGIKLRAVKRRGKNTLLVADDGRLSVGRRNAGQFRKKRGRRRKDGILSGAQTVPIFVLVPQVKLAKRFDLIASAEASANGLPAAIVSNWK